MRLLKPPVADGDLYLSAPEALRALMRLASACQFCERPHCCEGMSLDIPGALRRAAVGNHVGARKALAGMDDEDVLSACEERCVEVQRIGRAVRIREIARRLRNAEE